MTKRDKVEKTIAQLSKEDSYKLVYMPWHGRTMPSLEITGKLVSKLREVLFPGYFGNASLRPETYAWHIGVSTDEVYRMLSDQIRKSLCFDCSMKENGKCEQCEVKGQDLAADFIACLPEIRRILASDVRAVFTGDPAAKSVGEVIFGYPSVRAVTNHRIAHELYKLGVPLLPRMISEMAHSETGIDIHPGATIGECFAIDHGTGVVIGETTIIGNHVKIYQGVTLGAKSFPADENGHAIKGIPRHPIVEDDVIIYSNASILGRITIGKGSVIGGNIWVINDVPAHSKIIQRRPQDRAYTQGAGI
jgi:serine O-acetyltransferase